MAQKMEGLTAAWKGIDAKLRAINKKAKTILWALRIGTFFLWLAIMGSWALAGLAVYRPDLAGWFYLAAIILLSIGLIPWAVMIGLPLRFKSVVRLVDKGYPANAKELAIRAMARKLHDESIETEELLFETAVNEGRKVLRKLRQEEKRPEDRD